MRWPRESLSLAGRSGSNPDPGVVQVLVCFSFPSTLFFFKEMG